VIEPIASLQTLGKCAGCLPIQLKTAVINMEKRMNKRNIIIGIITVLAFATIVVLGYNGWSINAKSSKSMPRRDPTQTSTSRIRVSNDLPDHTVYHFLFAEIAYLKKRGAPAAKSIERIERAYEINDDQAIMVEQYALSCMEEVKQINSRAREIIRTAKAHYMENEVKRGLPIPPPPPVLRELQKERDATFLRWRKKLEDSMPNDFTRFDKKVREKFISSARVR
jgi:hypothetical protein